MPTMIQTPEIAGPEISGLQAIQRPGAPSGLGSFLQGLLPAVTDEIKKYQDSNAQKNIALGMSDELNKVHRDVSWLDRRNYNYGHQYQSVQNGQAILQKKFTDDVNGIDSADPEAANRIFDIGRDYMASTVQNVYESNLPDELKESLYNSTIKENAVYQQMINKKLQQLTSDAEYNTRLNMTSMLARDLRTKEFDVPSLKIAVQTFQEKVRDGMKNSTVQVWDDSTQKFTAKVPSAAEIQKETTLRLRAAFTNTMDTLEASGTAEDKERLQHLQEVSEMLVDVDLDLATYVQTKSTELQAKIETNNDSMMSRQVTELIADWENNPDGFNEELLNAAIADVGSNKSLSIGGQTAMINQLVNAGVSINKAIRTAAKTDITLYNTPDQYESIGKSPETWAKDWVEHFQKNNQGNPTKAGLEIMYKAKGADVNSPAYSSELMKRGSEILFRSMLGAVTMTDAEAKGDSFYKQRNDAFAEAGKVYRQLKASNGSAAIDMLAGIDDKHRAAFETVMENGGTLAQVREALKAPVQMGAKYEHYETARKAITADMLNLRSGTLGGTGGRFGRNIADELESVYVSQVKGALLDSKHSFVSNIGGDSPYDLLAAAKGTILLDSPAGYSSAIVPSRARQNMGRYRVDGSGEPLGHQYIGKAFDAQREAIAKQYGTRPDNVIVRVDDTGQTAQFYAYKIEKDFGGLTTGEYRLANGNPNGVLSGGVVSMARIQKEASDLYKKDKQRPKDSVQEGTKIGSVVIMDRSSGSKRGVGITVNALYAEGFGGNVALSKEWISHMNAYEWFLSKPRVVYDKNTGKPSKVYAMGVTEANMANDKTRKMFAAAEGNPQRLMDLQGGFMRSYYKNLDMPTMLGKVGVPAPTDAPYPPQFKRSLMLMYDTAWHGHRGALDRPAKGRSSIMQAMNAPTYELGLKHLKNTSVYDRKNPTGNLRNKWMEESLRQHYNAMGRR